MPINGLNVGRDVTVVIIDPQNGGIQTWTDITGFESKQQTKRLDSITMDGTNTYAEVPKGWDVSFMLDRSSSAVDDYFCAVEAGYYAGLDQSGIQITETITEVSGAITQYRYNNVVLKLSDAGSKTGDNWIKQKIDGVASTRQKIA